MGTDGGASEGKSPSVATTGADSQYHTVQTLAPLGRIIALLQRCVVARNFWSSSKIKICCLGLPPLLLRADGCGA